MDKEALERINELSARVLALTKKIESLISLMGG